MIALVDADSLLYKAGFAIEDKVVWNEQEVSLGTEEPEVEYYTDLEVCKGTFDRFVGNILFATDCDKAFLVFSGGGNFRDAIPTSYKENRVNSRKPLGYAELREYAETTYDSHTPQGMEADDYVVHLKTKEPEEYILCAIDKDVLYQTVGTHYNYGRDEEVTVNDFEAVWYAYYQVLTGDTSDGYKGAKNVGPVKAKKILEECENEQEMWQAVVETYESRGQTEEEALHTMQLANMHQFDGENIVLWTPPPLERPL